ncbi:hypothetical protein ACQ4PT_051108 [Festuca glaucescens]
MFNASVRISVGDGSRIMFWDDPWINGLTVTALAPAVVALVKPRTQRSRTVKDGVAGDAWALDISGPLSVDAIVQYLSLWAAVHEVVLGVGQDTFRWKWTSNGSFTARSAYLAMTEGTMAMAGADNIWNSFAPMSYRFHAWLALRRRCWTADRLLRRGLPTHMLCPLCKVHDEMLDHLSLDCPFAKAPLQICHLGGLALSITAAPPHGIYVPGEVAGGMLR